MRLKEIAPETETITFHIASDSKEFLKERAKLQKRPFSELVRDAVEGYIEDLRQDEALDRMREEDNALVKLYDRGKEFGDKHLDFAVFTEIKETSQNLLDNITTSFVTLGKDFHPSLFRESPPFPDDKVITETATILREIMGEYSKLMLRIYGMLLNYTVWRNDWLTRVEQFQRSLGKIIKGMDSSEPEKKNPR